MKLLGSYFSLQSFVEPAELESPALDRVPGSWHNSQSFHLLLAIVDIMIVWLSQSTLVSLIEQHPFHLAGSSDSLPLQKLLIGRHEV